MGIRRTYTRLSGTELEQALADPDWARARLRELGPGRDGWDQPPEGLRALDIDKGWVEVDLVMAGTGMSRTVLNGFHFLYPNDRPRDFDWEHLGEDERRARNPPTYRPPDQVRAVAAFLNQRPFGELLDAFDPMASSDLVDWQARGWPEDREYAVHHGERVQRFFAAAAQAGDAMVSYLR